MARVLVRRGTVVGRSLRDQIDGRPTTISVQGLLSFQEPVWRYGDPSAIRRLMAAASSSSSTGLIR
jgi:hypothetical protein